MPVVPAVLAVGCAVLAVDLSGSGHSSGRYVTLGATESIDTAVILNWLRGLPLTHGLHDKADSWAPYRYNPATDPEPPHLAPPPVHTVPVPECPITPSSIALWGRSMGAATAVFTAARDPGIAGIVLDSCFASLESLCYELVGQIIDVSLPRFVTGAGIKMIASSVKARAGVDVYSLNPEAAAAECHVPAFMGHGQQDDFVTVSHTERVYAAYAGDKQLHLFPGDHNSLRPPDFVQAATVFLLSVLVPPGSGPPHSAADDVDTPAPPAQPLAPVHTMSNREMKAELRAAGVSYRDCVERHELHERVYSARAQRGAT